MALRSGQLLPEETNLLYALLDAADTAGSLTPDQRSRWLECKARFSNETAHRCGPGLYALLDEIYGTGGAGEAWIRKRWSGLRAQVEARLLPPPPNPVRRRGRPPAA